MPLSVKELYDLQDYQRDKEIIARPGTPPAVVNFRDRQLDMALDYLRAQIKLTEKGNGKKAG